jgi:hypothetical protein
VDILKRKHVAKNIQYEIRGYWKGSITNKQTGDTGRKKNKNKLVLKI